MAHPTGESKDGARGYRVEAAGLTLSLGQDERLAQVQEPGCASGSAGGGGGLGTMISKRGRKPGIPQRETPNQEACHHVR